MAEKLIFIVIGKYPILLVIFICSLFISVAVFFGAEKDYNKTYTVKAIIIEKNSLNEFIIYKNEEGNLFKIPNALQFWECGEKGDSVLVSFKDMNNPEWIGLKRMK